jgi:hypothetical protein
MKSLVPVLVIAFLAAGATAQDQPARKANFTVSKETTYATGPVGPDGRIDYAAALNERLGKGVTADTNATVAVWRAFGPKPEGGLGMPAEFFKLLGIEEPPEKGDYFVDLWKFVREELELDDPELREEIEGQLARARRGPWTAKEYPYVSDWLKANQKPLDLLAEGMKRPHYFNPLTPRKGADGTSSLISALLPAVQKCRVSANAFTARAMLRLGEGKADEAWQDLLACHRLGRHLAHAATLIEGLVGIAIESIAQRTDLALLERPELTAKAFQNYMRDLRALPPMPGLAHQADLGERFMYLDLMMLADRKGLQDILDGLAFADGLPAAIAERRKLPAGPMENMNWDPALRAANRVFDRLAAAARHADRARREAELNRIDAELKAMKEQVIESGDLEKAITGQEITPEARGKMLGDLLLALMAPSVRKTQQAYDRVEQCERNLQIAFALAAYQRDNGTYPKALDVLAPKYMTKVPDDLFTGKPLVYRPAEKGFLLYSFGPNAQDDEGRWYDDDPRGDDPSVRVPLPESKK